SWFSNEVRDRQALNRRRTAVTVRIDTPRATLCNRQIQEYETVDDGELAAVEKRQGISGRVRHEIRERHFAREHKRDGPCEQPDQKQQSSTELEYTGKADQGHELNVVERCDMRYVQQLRHAVLQEQCGNDDTQYAQHPRRPDGEK